jgi:nitrile hydratase accessory protein
MSIAHRDQSEHQSEAEPVFQAPWEAKAFAIVNQLAANQQYSWAEWTDYLAQEIAQGNSEASESLPYYVQWVQACEKLLIAKGLLAKQAIDQRVQELQADQHTDH